MFVFVYISVIILLCQSFHLTRLFFRLRRGDQILAVNDTDISRATHEEAARVSLRIIPGLIGLSSSPFTPLRTQASPPVTEMKKCPEHLRHSSLITSEPALIVLTEPQKNVKMWRHSDLINNNAFPTIVCVGENSTFINSNHSTGGENNLFLF